MHAMPLHDSIMWQQLPGSGVSEAHDRNAEWVSVEGYWGKITRNQLKGVLCGKPDGRFLVRDALCEKIEVVSSLYMMDLER